MPASPAANLPWYLVVVLGLAMWIGISHFLALFGGWRALAKSYRVAQRPAGRSYIFRSAQIGLVNYGSCLTFLKAASGLFISVQLPFRLAHPPLLIPWPDIVATEHRGWIFHYVDLSFAKQPGVRIRLFRGLAQALLSDQPR